MLAHLNGLELLVGKRVEEVTAPTHLITQRLAAREGEAGEWERKREGWGVESKWKGESEGEAGAGEEAKEADAPAKERGEDNKAEEVGRDGRGFR